MGIDVGNQKNSINRGKEQINQSYEKGVFQNRLSHRSNTKELTPLRNYLRVDHINQSVVSNQRPLNLERSSKSSNVKKTDRSFAHNAIRNLNQNYSLNNLPQFERSISNPRQVNNSKNSFITHRALNNSMMMNDSKLGQHQFIQQTSSRKHLRVNFKNKMLFPSSSNHTQSGEETLQLPQMEKFIEVDNQNVKNLNLSQFQQKYKAKSTIRKNYIEKITQSIAGQESGDDSIIINTERQQQRNSTFRTQENGQKLQLPQSESRVGQKLQLSHNRKKIQDILNSHRLNNQQQNSNLSSQTTNHNQSSQLINLHPDVYHQHQQLSQRSSLNPPEYIIKSNPNSNSKSHSNIHMNQRNSIEAVQQPNIGGNNTIMNFETHIKIYNQSPQNNLIPFNNFQKTSKSLSKNRQQHNNQKSQKFRIIKVNIEDDEEQILHDDINRSFEKNSNKKRQITPIRNDALINSRIRRSSSGVKTQAHNKSSIQLQQLQSMTQPNILQNSTTNSKQQKLHRSSTQKRYLDIDVNKGSSNKKKESSNLGLQSFAQDFQINQGMHSQKQVNAKNLEQKLKNIQEIGWGSSSHMKDNLVIDQQQINSLESTQFNLTFSNNLAKNLAANLECINEQSNQKPQRINFEELNEQQKQQKQLVFEEFYQNEQISPKKQTLKFSNILSEKSSPTRYRPKIKTTTTNVDEFETQQAYQTDKSKQTFNINQIYDKLMLGYHQILDRMLKNGGDWESSNNIAQLQPKLEYYKF
eukprot:403337149